MKKLSTGQDSTLRNWYSLSLMFFGKDSDAVKFLEKKAKQSERGWDEEVVADERQLIGVLVNLHKKGLEKRENTKN